MITVQEGQRYWKRGDHQHVWVVDAVVQHPEESRHYAILVADDGDTEVEVDLHTLLDQDIYSPVPEESHSAERV